MAVYDLGTASLSANGEVTGVGTTWKAPLTLIRVGATIVFKTEPVKIYTISEIISDTQINVYNPNSETVPAGTGYAILAHDGITVQGLAQDVAETLRYYQSRETEVADAVDAFNNFDANDFSTKVAQVNTQHNEVVSIGVQVSNDAAQVSIDKDSASTSSASAHNSANIAMSAADSVSGALVGNFEDGVTLQSKNQVIIQFIDGSAKQFLWSGSFPKVVPAGSTPESTGGEGPGAWVSAGDGSLRGHLASKLGYSLIGELDSVSGFYGLYGEDNSRVKLKSWSSDYILATGGKPTGGGEFIFVPTMPKTSHNGGTIISPSVPYSSISAFLAGTGETDPSGSGCWVRDFDGAINALWFGAVGDGITDNSAQLAAFRNAVVAQAAKRRGYIPAGTYAYNFGPNYAVKGVHIFGDGKNNTILKNTSGERAFRIEGSEYGMAAVYDVVVENIGIEGHAGTQHLFYVENASHLTMRNINFREASPTTGNVMSLLWTVASVFENITCSINEQPMTNKPYHGIVVSTSPSRNLKSTANLFINVIIEGVGGTGIRLLNTDLNTFIGGTSEANGTYGITTTGESRQNKFVGMGFEGNGTADLLDGGQDTALENCYTGKSIVLLSSSRRARIVGGLHERIEMQSGCSAANIENLTVNYFDTGSGGIYDSGTNSSFRNIFDLDANAYVYRTKLRQSIPVTASPFTYTNTTGECQNVLTTGGTVTRIQFSRGGSSTVTGMTAGFVMLAPGDSLIVSYAVAPTMSRVPMGNNNL